MALRWYTTVIDCTDHLAQAEWWATTLGWRVFFSDEDEAVVLPPWATESELPFERVPPGLVFVPVPEGKEIKNRLHLDLAGPTSDDREAHISALIARGASLADVGQGDDLSWTVLRDPEGNEFCVLSSRDR